MAGTRDHYSNTYTHGTLEISWVVSVGRQTPRWEDTLLILSHFQNDGSPFFQFQNLNFNKQSLRAMQNQLALKEVMSTDMATGKCDSFLILWTWITRLWSRNAKDVDRACQDCGPGFPHFRTATAGAMYFTTRLLELRTHEVRCWTPL